MCVVQLVFKYLCLDVCCVCLIFVVVYVQYNIVFYYIVCIDGWQCGEFFIQWCEIWMCGVKQLFEVVDCEVGFLECVDVVVCMYDVVYVKVDVVWVG